MYTSLLYKEWLKIRWAFSGMLLVSLLVLTYILLNVSYYIELNTAKGFWGNVILMGYPFFTEIRYIPALAGIVIAASQFVPEMSQSRLKLTFHLPVKENVILFQMLSIGFGLQILLTVLMTVFLSVITSKYFPAEVVNFMLESIFPWMSAGVAAYFLTAAVIIEPLWKRRLIILPFLLGFIDLYFTAEYVHFNLDIFFILAALAASILIMLPGYHFKRGLR